MKIGILGGGQLGCMLSESIIKYGGTPIVLCRDGEPATDRVRHCMTGSWSDPDLLKRFFDTVDVATIEVEHVDLDALAPFADQLRPSIASIRTTQHRIHEKRFLAAAGLPHAQVHLCESVAEAKALLNSNMTYPRVLKTALGGYDGRGQFFLESEADFAQALDELGDHVDAVGIVVEEALDIHAEYSCIAANSNGQLVSFPVFENDHKDHILDTTTVPANIPAALESEARRVAMHAAKELGISGLLTTEFFVTKTKPEGPVIEVDGHYLMVNEFAPRPHNSGHVTRNACTLSQFDILARALLNLPLIEPKLHAGGFSMANLLSDIWGEHEELPLDALGAHQDVVDVILYGKSPSRPKRKMGHIVAAAANADTARNAAVACRDDLDRR